MKTFLTSLQVALLTMAATVAGAASAAPDIGVSVQISQPGVFGRVDIGRFPQPPVILPQPVVVRVPPVVAPPQPIYMWVPPGHRKNWRKHCGQYNACGVPVYFVRHDWYDEHVHPRGKARHGKGERGDDEHGERGRDHERGHGKGRGKGG